MYKSTKMSLHITKLQHIPNGGYVKTKTKIKICKDCKHYERNHQMCKLFQATDLVTGQDHSVSATTARESTNMCGQGGALFEHHMSKQ